MTARREPTRRARAAATVGIVAAALCALGNLPSEPLPPGWLLAFTAPGALLGLAARLPLRGWQRFVLGAALQIAACWLAFTWVGPMTRPGALACTILPPLAFAAVRGEATDHALALFLSFCVLLVGVILDGAHWPWIASYAAAASFALRATARVQVESFGAPVPLHTPLPRHRALLPLPTLCIAGVIAAIAVFDRLLATLPSPSRTEDAANPAGGGGGPRRIGLDDSFVLDGQGGLLAGLTGEQLVRVKSNDDEAVPGDLYLRSGFFGAPGLDRWQLGRLDLAPPSADEGHRLREPSPDRPLHSLMIERYAGAQQFVFVPPGICSVEGLGGVRVDPAREWIRQATPSDGNVYDVTYQRRVPTTRAPFDPRSERLGLLELPHDFDRTRWQALLVEWQVADEPLAAIAKGLAGRCRYDRLEPSGPYAHTLDNFLFADGDRRGYCMHFASAAALLLRMHGVPCRIAVGLYGGMPDRRDARARLFGSQHAHAWVEIPYATVGYVVFDPTPAAERGQSTPSSRPSEAEEPAATEAATDGRAWLDTALALLQRPWVLALLLVFAITTTLLPHAPRRRAATAGSTVPRSARRALGRLLQALAERGSPRLRGQTLEAYAADLARRGHLLPAVTAAFAAYQEVRFGGRPFDAVRERALAHATDAARLAAASPDVSARPAAADRDPA